MMRIEELARAAGERHAVLTQTDAGDDLSYEELWIKIAETVVVGLAEGTGDWWTKGTLYRLLGRK